MSRRTLPAKEENVAAAALEMRRAHEAEAAMLRARIAEQKKEATRLAPIQETSESHPAVPEGPANPVHRATNPLWQQILRLIEFTFWFNWCCAIIHTTQWLLSPTYLFNKNWFYNCMAVTKEQFGILIVTVTQWFCPTLIRVSGDLSVQHQLVQTSDGRLHTRFPERMVLIANHQIYTEWLYLWWIAYTSHMHGAIYIILKKSLQYIPTLGPAMKFYGFIFIARNWAQDQLRFYHRLQILKQSYRNSDDDDPSPDPMWLLIFPEGTNLSANTRKRSAAYAKKQDIQDLEHLLLPRSTGLRYCLMELRGTLEWVYDCTIAYEGVPRDQYAQDLFTLRSVFLQGRPPKSVNMYWRRIHMSSIPLDDDVAFEKWLWSQWLAKESLIEHFAQHNRFPAMERGRGHIETEVKLGSLLEIGQIFVIVAIVALICVFLLQRK